MRPTIPSLLRRALCLLVPIVCLHSPSAWAQDDNKGGKLLITTNRAWYADSLLFDSFNGRPVLNHLKPAAAKTFLVVSAQIDIDWTGFPKASQFPLRTSDVTLAGGDTPFKPIGIYNKGGRYSDFLSSMLWPQRSSKAPYFLDLVFCVPRTPEALRLKIGDVESPLAIQPGSGESEKPPGTFKIVQAVLVDEMPSGAVPSRNSQDYQATLKPVSGKLLKLTVAFNATAPYADNSEGLYRNDTMPLFERNIGIIAGAAGYIPAAGAVLNDKAYIGGGTMANPGQPKATEFTFLFAVPGPVPVITLLYDHREVIKDFKLP